MTRLFLLTLASLVFLTGSAARAQKAELIPHAQDKSPGDPLSPSEAVQKMKVPKGFTVEIVASEPMIVNPVAMTFDERGRVWITESLEYPRREPGPGRDRIKILEDTDNDGSMDKATVFAEGLNIPSGIAVGHGGVWVVNSPDLLFMQDTDGDGKADKTEVVVTGFGRDDTHELPNSLTWGPDGWLYGWNGVFNRSLIHYRGKTFDFTCAIFRIHPVTREFEVFCEGTSNPWGLTFNYDGAAFASACVIDHLWHLTETGYYHRQGGPYPPHTWKIESIVNFGHQKAAYCGITYFDSDAYPAIYRDKLYMGNIHGNCINVDTLTRNGSTYKGGDGPDFLSANDAWFMPVAQKTGPDGSLYILDWYDRYHCYQDANRDPAGIDRLKGRLYRVRYKDTPRVKIDLASESDDQLIGRLSAGNIFLRETAQRLLIERANPASRRKLEAIVLDVKTPSKTQMHALWAVVSQARLDLEFHKTLLDSKMDTYRTWGVRAAGNMRKVDPAISRKISMMASDLSPDVRLQVVIASKKIEGLDALPVLLGALSASSDDPIIPQIIWRNLNPLLETKGAEFVNWALADHQGVAREILPRAVARLLEGNQENVGIVADLLAGLLRSRAKDKADLTRSILTNLADRIQRKELGLETLGIFKAKLGLPLAGLIASGSSDPFEFDAAILAGSWGDKSGLESIRRVLTDTKADPSNRLRALAAGISGQDANSVQYFIKLLNDRSTPVDFRGAVLATAGRLEDVQVGSIVIDAYEKMESSLKPRAIELLTQRASWSVALIRAIADKRVPTDAINVNQLRRLAASKDVELNRLVKANLGTIRESRNHQRDLVISQVRTMLTTSKGNPNEGMKAFAKVCGQCHKIYGEGQDVGPDITRNGRASFEQLLSNVFDPSLVIGTGFQATTVATTDGRILTGLIVEDSPQRVILKLQGGKLETVPRAQVEELKTSALSLMPEGVEAQLTPQEIADLFAFITLDKHPSDSEARPIPGAK